MADLIRSGRAIAHEIDMLKKQGTRLGVMLHATDACPSWGIISKPEDIVFTKADANWVHHPHEDALVITTKIANSLIHKILVDNGSIVNIFYWDTY